MGVCCCVVGTHAQRAGSSTRSQKLGRRRRWSAAGTDCVQLEQAGRWATPFTRPVCRGMYAACSDGVTAGSRGVRTSGSWAQTWQPRLLGPNTHGRRGPRASWERYYTVHRRCSTASLRPARAPMAMPSCTLSCSTALVDSGGGARSERCNRALACPGRALDVRTHRPARCLSRPKEDKA